jgi:hypothetical protein
MVGLLAWLVLLAPIVVPVTATGAWGWTLCYAALLAVAIVGPPRRR